MKQYIRHLEGDNEGQLNRNESENDLNS
jgi:hypothetical protein